jgi:BlaI family penicillinase repressor
MSKLETLSRRERELMQILFRLERATIAELSEQMEAAPTRPAMRSIIKGLEHKGLLRQCEKRGREYLFEPIPQATEEGPSALRKILKTFFGGSMSSGIAAYLNDPERELDRAELEQIEALIKEAKERPNPKA